MCSAHVGRSADPEGKLTASLAGRGTWCPRRGEEDAPPASSTRRQTLKVTATRWYPVLIMRDQPGRFAKLRVALVEKRRKARQSMRRLVHGTAVQLVLF